MLKPWVFMRAGLKFPLGAIRILWGEPPTYDRWILRPSAGIGQWTWFSANQHLFEPTANSRVITASVLASAPAGRTSSIISACLRVASSRPKASCQKYARTHPQKAARRDRGPRTRAQSRAAERAEEGGRHGRSQRERRVPHGQAAAGVRAGAPGTTQEAHGRAVHGQHGQYSARPGCDRVHRGGL